MACLNVWLSLRSTISDWYQYQSQYLSSILWYISISCWYDINYINSNIVLIIYQYVCKKSHCTELLLSMKMKNNQKYNSILTVICCITKYALFIFIWNDIIITDFTKFFFEHVEYYFDFSKNIVMNRNSHITSNFWQEICEI